MTSHRATPLPGEGIESAKACLVKATELLKAPPVGDEQTPIHDLETLAVAARRSGLQATVVQDWIEVDAALAASRPVILIGNAMVRRAHGKRLGMTADGINFLLLSERNSTKFPTTGGPFAVETVSYLAHDPHHHEGPVWVCLGELRGYCDAVAPPDVLGVALART